jgi:hypothetical protein
MAVFAASVPVLARLPADRRGARPAVVGLAVLGAACTGLAGLATPTVGLLAMTGFMAAQAYLYLVAREGIERTCGGTGRAWGAFGVFSDTGFMLGPAIGVLLFQVWGAATFAVLGAVPLLAGVLLLCVVRRPSARPARAPAMTAG